LTAARFTQTHRACRSSSRKLRELSNSKGLKLLLRELEALNWFRKLFKEGRFVQL
jgi:hypothetical protein